MIGEAGAEVSSLSALIALTSCVTAAIATYVAYQQHKTARDKVRLDLYDRRFAVYAALQEFLASISVDARVDLAILAKYSRSTREAEFLFGAEVSAYLDSIHREAVEYRKLNNVLLSPQGMPRHDDLAEQEGLALQRLLDHFELASIWFRPYLQFDR